MPFVALAVALRREAGASGALARAVVKGASAFQGNSLEALVAPLVAALVAFLPEGPKVAALAGTCDPDPGGQGIRLRKRSPRATKVLVR